MARKRILADLFRIGIVIISSAIFALSVTWFLEPIHLVSTGVTGICQIIRRLFALGNIDIPLGVLTFSFNIPLFIYGYKSVSPKFILYTFISVVAQSIMLLGWVPAVDFGLDPVQNMMLFTIIGGLAAGVGIGIALRYGTSTGGIDILAQAINLKKNISIGSFCGIINIFLAVIAGGIMESNWAITLYSFIYIIISNIVVDKIHTAYNYLRIDVVTKYSESVSSALINGINRGCTILDVKGAYTHEDKFDLFMVVSSYELEKAKRIIHEVDPQAFVMVSPIKRIIGAFFKHTIV